MAEGANQKKDPSERDGPKADQQLCRQRSGCLLLHARVAPTRESVLMHAMGQMGDRHPDKLSIGLCPVNQRREK